MDTYANTPEERIAILEKIRKDPSLLKDINPSLLSNQEFMLDAIKENPEAMKYAPESFYKDPKFLFEVLKNDPSAILQAPVALQAKYAEEGISAFKPDISDTIKDVLGQFRIGEDKPRKLPTPYDNMLKPTPFD
jgi:hypothetical protein